MTERIELPADIDCYGDGAYLEREPDGAWWVCAKNQGGYDHTTVHLGALLKWLRENRPDLLEAK